MSRYSVNDLALAQTFVLDSRGNLWGRGAVGSAPESHSGGQGFESPRLHQK